VTSVLIAESEVLLLIRIAKLVVIFFVQSVGLAALPVLGVQLICSVPAPPLFTVYVPELTV